MNSPSATIDNPAGGEQPRLTFTFDGLLPAGDYEMTLPEIRSSILVKGPDGTTYKHWDSKWRAHLIDNLETIIGQLNKRGVTEIFVDGSFTEDKDHPNDIDGYFTCDPFRIISGDLQRELNLLDPHKVWTWDPRDRRSYPGSPKKQLPMWHQYRVEMYPHLPGLGSGIKDKRGHELDFPSAFRQCRRTDKPKGIVKIGGCK
ncbi:MAG: hypothetical protein QOK37_718 [Thermoanaerobaculia bacterium]|jgi:hypothetical protein|nr:hypothetical protein [Thermoanaerobaculia bacterium]